MKIAFFPLLVFFSVGIKAQYVTIPDGNFVNYLTIIIPACMNGNQMDTTCTDVVNATALDAYQENINDLAGVQYFDNLQTLNCYQNSLSSLPPLPQGLIELNCYNNSLTSLPLLPSGFLYLNCNSNLLVSLPTLPSSLFHLDCGNNLLTTLPALPNDLSYLDCRSNQLGSIPPLSENMTECYLGNNPLTCLPRLRASLINLNFTNTLITCVPNNDLGLIFSNPSLLSFPLCDSMNTNGCPYCHAYFSIYPDSTNQGIYYGYNQSYGSNLTSYLWEFGDGDTSTLQYPSHTYSQPGQYYVCLTASSLDCTNTYCDSSFYVFKTEGGLMSELHILDPNAPVGIKDVNANLKITVYPNPATNQLTINLGGFQVEQVSIYNVDGKLVSETKQPANNSIDISGLAKGVYVAEVTPKSPPAISGINKGDFNTNTVRVRWVKM